MKREALFPVEPCGSKNIAALRLALVIAQSASSQQPKVMATNPPLHANGGEAAFLDPPSWGPASRRALGPHLLNVLLREAAMTRGSLVRFLFARRGGLARQDPRKHANVSHWARSPYIPANVTFPPVFSTILVAMLCRG